ncbi:MAG TPA: SDR family NAD(P)-dependent oxidoreductase [Candidatus Methylomirabilis sp.]|jgi:NAD(P)-dependent dehydrogenase (short-subunit alcohol dehydrogenase family)|nr:SDR family NAD(P)-dependent oxidoreductase [Candidatus Methylomirabilis sp.]
MAGLLAGRVALITGASQGIGRAVAAAFGREGATLALCARRPAPLEQAAAALREQGVDVLALPADLGKAADIASLVEGVRQRFGRLHVLVNNASLLGPMVPLAEYPPEAWEAVLAVNLTGPFLLTGACLPLLRAAGGGSVINVSSGVGRTGRKGWGAYAVSKFGLEGFTQILADELREEGIRVNAVNPGGTRTVMRAAAMPGEDPMTLPTPEAITPVFLYLASEASRDATGKSLDARDWIGKSVGSAGRAAGPGERTAG